MSYPQFYSLWDGDNKTLSVRFVRKVECSNVSVSASWTTQGWAWSPPVVCRRFAVIASPWRFHLCAQACSPPEGFILVLGEWLEACGASQGIQQSRKSVVDKHPGCPALGWDECATVLPSRTVLQLHPVIADWIITIPFSSFPPFLVLFPYPFLVFFEITFQISGRTRTWSQPVWLQIAKL